jgi:hypothetical protein
VAWWGRKAQTLILSSLCLLSGSKYSSNINEIDKSEQKSSPDGTGKGIPYEWPQNDSGCKYHIVIPDVYHARIRMTVQHTSSCSSYRPMTSHPALYIRLYICSKQPLISPSGPRWLRGNFKIINIFVFISSPFFLPFYSCTFLLSIIPHFPFL